MTKDALYAGFAIFLAGLILFVVVGALIETWRKRRVRLAGNGIPAENQGREA